MGDIHLDLVSEASIPEIEKLREKLRVKEQALARIEANVRNGKESSAYINTKKELEELKDSVPPLIHELKYDAAKQYSGYQLYEKKTQLSQKQNLLERLRDRRKELEAKMQEEGNTRHEFQFASEELQRALALFAKISERESELSATVGLPRELADELWGDKTQAKQPESIIGSKAKRR